MKKRINRARIERIQRSQVGSLLTLPKKDNPRYFSAVNEIARLTGRTPQQAQQVYDAVLQAGV